MFNRFPIRFTTCTVFMFVSCLSSLNAQSTPVPTVPESSTQETQVPSLDEKPPKLSDLSNDGLFSKEFTRELLKDQARLWSSPARIKPADIKWLVPLAAGTGVLLK